MQLYIYIILAYIILVFGLSRWFVPHLNNKPIKVPDKLPDVMIGLIDEIKAKAQDRKNFLQLSYQYIGNRYRSERFNTVLKFSYLWKSLDQVWLMSGYVPCTLSNYLLSVFLIKSGYFFPDDIRKRQVFVNFVPHQYLQVRVDDRWIDVDVGEKQRGMPIGKHLKWFG